MRSVQDAFSQHFQFVPCSIRAKTFVLSEISGFVNASQPHQNLRFTDGYSDGAESD